MNEGSDHDNVGCELPEQNLEKEVISANHPQNIFYQKSSNIEEMNMNDNHYIEDEPYSAPVEILSEFLSTLMARNYKSALYYCKLILLYEPDNEVVKGFYPLIKEKMQLDNYDSDEYGDTDENSSTKSGSSTEYFSSTSVGTENMSSSSSLNSEEEESSLD